MNKSYPVIPFIAVATILACTPLADYESKIQDLRFDNPAGWQFINTSAFYVDSDISETSVQFQVNQCNGRTVTVSAEPVAGIYIQPEEIALPSGAAPATISASLAGTTCSTPGTYTLVVDITYDSGKKISWPVSFELLQRPDFGVQMDPIFAGNALIETERFRSDYKYNVIGTEYDSDTEMLYLKLPYQFGGGRTISIDSYEISDENGNDLKDEWSLSIENPELADNAEDMEYVLIGLTGKAAGKKTVIISDLELSVTDPDDNGYKYVIGSENGITFADGRLKFRIFDIIHTHRMNPDGSETLDIGYDTELVPSSTDPSKGRMLIVQPLGRIDNPDEYINPFLYQWGRKEDGHQRAYTNQNCSGISGTLSDNPLVSDFIKSSGTWQENPSLDDALWDDTETGGVNNPCPEGYRIPSIEEADYMRDWLSGFSGLRRNNNGTIVTNANILVWSCSPHPTDQTKALSFDGTKTSGASYSSRNDARGNGFPVRCISIQEININ